MIGRWAVMLAPACLYAQFQVALVTGLTERPASGVVEIGTVETGDVLDARFRLRTAQGSPAILSRLEVAGTGFSLPGPLALPVTLATGGALDFIVRFQPAAPGAFSAVLTINTTTLLLRATATQGIVVWLEAGDQRQRLLAGANVDFGTVSLGTGSCRRFVLENPTTAGLVVNELSVSGAGFSAVSRMELPLVVEGGASVAFEIAFSPLAAGTSTGLLVLNGRKFNLVGTGLGLALPKPEILLDPPLPRSGEQVRVSIRLAAPSPLAAQGELSIAYFIPGILGVSDDPGLGFLAPTGRVVSFSVEPGSVEGNFGGRKEVVMQTGTTAGKVVLLAKLGSETAQATIMLAPAPIVIEAVRAVRGASGLELSLTGFDNTRSASELGFTFFDREGRLVQPGQIKVDASREFRSYFETSPLGGLFALRALFPVTGDPAGITGVEVEIRNNTGVARTGRVAF